MDVDPKIKAQLAQYTDWTLLGAGGLGQTWRARDELTGRVVVLKIKPATDISRTAMQRESELMAQLRHPGLQAILGQQIIANQLVLIYAYVDGISVAEQLKRHPFPVPAAAKIIAELLDALAVIHKAGFIHRDVNPENVILQDGQRPVLIDFDAIGQLTEHSALGSSTVVGEFAGKVRYMAPEQLAAAPQTASADIWAVGALFYEMVTGRRYLDGLSLSEIVQASVSADGPQISDAPREIQPFLARSLSSDAARRPSAEEARLMIEALGNGGIIKTMMEPDRAVLTPARDALGGKEGAKGSTSINADEFRELLQQDLGTKSPEPAPPLSARPAPSEHRGFGVSSLSLVLLGGFALLGAGAAVVFVRGGPFFEGDGADPTPPDDPLPWEWFNAPDPGSTLLVVLGIALIALGFAVARTLRRRASEVRVALPFEAMQLISGPDAHTRLSETICVQIDAYREAAGNAADKMLTLTMVALAKEYADAESHDQRLAALKMLHELHGKVADRLQPWWLSYDTVMARGISLASLAGGALVVWEGVQRLL